MAYVEYSSQGWLSRLGSSVVGSLIGVLLFLGSFAVLFWNEGRAVQTARSLEEGQAAVQTVSPDAVDPAHQGKLVHVTGAATTDEVLRDGELGASANALKLVRATEMYQWEEHEESRTRHKAGGGTETERVYEYNKTWSSQVIDSGDFRESGHDNPRRMRYPHQTFLAERAHLGAFELQASHLDALEPNQTLPWDSALRDALARHIPDGRVSGEYFFVGKNPEHPQIGDERIRFRLLAPGPVSIVAQQMGSSFAPYQTSAGDKLLIVEPGTHTAQELFRAAEQKNTATTWALRFGGWLMMLIGLALAFKPLSVAFDVLPFLGSIASLGTFAFAFAIASVFSTGVVAVAWFFYRPLLSIPLLLAIGGALYWLATQGRRRRQASAAGAR